MACFRRNGVVATNLTDICTEAGLSMGALYKFFKNRDDLLEEVLHVLMARRDTLLQGKTWVDLRDGLVEYRKEIAANPFWLEFEGVIHWSKRLSAARAKHAPAILAQLERHLAHFAAQGEISPAFDLKRTAVLISVIFDGTLIPARASTSFAVSYTDLAAYLDFAVGAKVSSKPAARSRVRTAA